ncbi:hypothetical protein TSAR_002170 [Trichomalopsis sarcophagae]|uniref:Dehydrogenase/reductase SDR family member 11 n=1 Tax=Trichomalopsis sarcophagae TaxID=543379 RepID=A0A232FC58_9HYME|nr:hypothetical protein TSAR_002170 [Trichomalopsis sarcophagae]
MERWAGKVAVVTGASVGIGAAIVNKLLDNGLIVVGLARRVEKVKELIDDRPEANKLHAVECDVTNEENVVTAFAWIKENLGSVDVLVNNAGVSRETTLSDGSLADWRNVLDVNVLGLCVCTREAVRSMRECDGESVIIHMSSLAGERVPAVPGFNVYPATKRAVNALAQTLRHELAGTKIRVTVWIYNEYLTHSSRFQTISPGLVATELMANYSAFTPEVLTAMPALLPSDVAEAVSFVLSMPSHVLVQDIVLRPLGESCLALIHQYYHFLGQNDHSKNVYVHSLSPILDASLDDQRWQVDRGAIDQDLNDAEVLLDPLHLIVTLQNMVYLHFIDATSYSDDFHSVVNEELGDGSADSTAGSGDEGDFVDPTVHGS